MKVIFTVSRLALPIIQTLAVIGAILVGWQSIRTELLVVYWIGLSVVLLQQIVFMNSEITQCREAIKILYKGESA